MATNLHTSQPVSTNPGFESIRVSIDLEQVSISQLLGRDYVFINAQSMALPVKNSAFLNTLLDNLMTQLELVEAHTVAVSVYESPSGHASFTRHDLTWHKHKICHVESMDIVQTEQYEFMDMIWRCSTSASTA